MTENQTFSDNTSIANSENIVDELIPRHDTEFGAMGLNPTLGMVKRVDFTEYAIDQSGAHKGDAKALNIMFNEIRSGHLIDESEDFDYQEKYRLKLAEQILQLEKESEEMHGEKLKIKDVNIPKLKSKVLELEKEFHDWTIKLQQPAEKDIMNKFTLWKYGISLALGLVYICLFYISCVYMGMVRNPIAEAEKLYQGDGDASSLFSAIFSMQAYLVFDFHYFSPILLLLFAVLLDYINTNQIGWRRILGLISAGTITLILDAFIAFKIENTNHEMKKLMGMEDPNHLWYLSSDFYIVLIMGFVATLVWGILLIAFKAELQKTDHKKIIGLQMTFVKKQIQDLKNEISNMELAFQDLDTHIRKIILDIKKLSERKTDMRISIPKLERYISKFFAGWMEYVAIKKNETIKTECHQVYEKFRETHINRAPLVPVDA